mmetsp:Transcript_8446/g.12783  ORF Transcript_8446/g.12783 Transcript_8446/m.12783 type:complete len:354 (+) Transcript_8446:123-1184(+)
MGKKSRESNKNASSPHYKELNPNALPRVKTLKPEAWIQKVESINPIISAQKMGCWLCIDGEFVVPPCNTQKQPQDLGFCLSKCRLCFKLAIKTCSQCRTTSYCSKQCQLLHWKESHKKACKPNPSPALMKGDLDVFRSLSPSDFVGHEFILIKPVPGPLSLQEICDQCLEPADDIMDIPGFGHDQIQELWAAQNYHDRISQQIVKKYGWTSGRYGVDSMEGYLPKEDDAMVFMMSDDSFLMQMDLQPSYYGGACYPQHVRNGKQVRGNVVVFQIILKNKVIKKQLNRGGSAFNLCLTDDSDLKYEYEMYPISKASVAHMLQERMNVLEDKSFTRRMWRHVIRQKEREVEQKIF